MELDVLKHEQLIKFTRMIVNQQLTSCQSMYADGNTDGEIRASMDTYSSKDDDPF